MPIANEDVVAVAKEFLAAAHEKAKKPLVAIDIRTGNIGRQGVAWVETMTALSAIEAALSAAPIERMMEALAAADKRIAVLDAECERAWEAYRISFDQAMSNGQSLVDLRASLIREQGDDPDAT